MCAHERLDVKLAQPVRNDLHKHLGGVYTGSRAFLCLL